MSAATYGQHLTAQRKRFDAELAQARPMARFELIDGYGATAADGTLAPGWVATLPAVVVTLPSTFTWRTVALTVALALEYIGGKQGDLHRVGEFRSRPGVRSIIWERVA